MKLYFVKVEGLHIVDASFFIHGRFFKEIYNGLL